MWTLLTAVAERGNTAILLAGFLLFSLLYFGFAGLAWWLSQSVFPSMRIGETVDRRPLRAGQIRREIARSLVSIAIFAVYGWVAVLAYRVGWVHVRLDSTALAVVADAAILLAWNELHFYGCHRWLHTRWLYRNVHRVHHDSAVPTPFSTYSFHWLEAAMLGSVMISAMLLRDFSLPALASLPVLSLLFNTIGHWNYNLLARTRLRSASVAHGQHHLRVHGNYGFYSPVPDRLFGTHL